MVVIRFLVVIGSISALIYITIFIIVSNYEDKQSKNNIEIHTIPIGATVFDTKSNSELGVTTFFENNPNPGIYNYEIRKDKFHSVKLTITVIDPKIRHVHNFKLRPIEETEWSSNLGQFDWKSANRKCDSIGMRLPTSEEFVDADHFGIKELWESEEEYKGENLWTSDSVKQAPIDFSSSMHATYFLHKSSFGSASDGTLHDVRCHKNN